MKPIFISINENKLFGPVRIFEYVFYVKPPFKKIIC